MTLPCRRISEKSVIILLRNIFNPEWCFLLFLDLFWSLRTLNYPLNLELFHMRKHYVVGFNTESLRQQWQSKILPTQIKTFVSL